jgi:dTMP kinase
VGRFSPSSPGITGRSSQKTAKRAQPDLLVLLDVPPEVGLARIRERGDEPNKFESEESLGRAREIFQHIRRPYLLPMDARTGIEIIHFHLKHAFLVAAANKISAHEFSPSGMNRMRELLG